jgi:hypothetical protein
MTCVKKFSLLSAAAVLMLVNPPVHSSAQTASHPLVHLRLLPKTIQGLSRTS